jgi:hypothetical protein
MRGEPDLMDFGFHMLQTMLVLFLLFLAFSSAYEVLGLIGVVLITGGLFISAGVAYYMTYYQQKS